MAKSGANANAIELARGYAKQRFALTDSGHPAVAAMIELSVSAAQALMESGEPLPEAPKARTTEPPAGPKTPMDPIEMLRREIPLPSLPQVFEELNRALGDDSTSAGEIAAIVSRDTGLSAMLLRLVNSAFYSFPSQIDTITRAVALVGLKQIGALALGGSAMSLFPKIPDKYMDVRTFWRHSVAVGLLARGLAERVNYDDPERMFVAGLLHDVGRLALVNGMPEKAMETIDMARGQGMLLYEAERALLGFDHAKLGGIMLRKWNLPYGLVNAVLHHHDPEQAKAVIEPSLTHVADALACAVMLCPYGEPLVPPIDPEAWETLGLEPEDLIAAANASMRTFEETWQALNQ
jgi:putative nucleotidyltransferase with HDIG domain